MRIFGKEQTTHKLKRGNWHGLATPYKSTDFTFELKIFILVPLEMFMALHTFPRMLTMTLALLILFFTSAPVPPS
jgi:hypothetical protein